MKKSLAIYLFIKVEVSEDCLWKSGFQPFPNRERLEDGNQWDLTENQQWSIIKQREVIKSSTQAHALLCKGMHNVWW